jgi:hypothetical protein
MPVNKLLLLVIGALILNFTAQLFVLPTYSYLAELWFPLEERFLTIGIGFYFNILGYGTAATISAMLSFPHSIVTVNSITLSYAILSTISFLLSLILIKNQPKKQTEVRIYVKLKKNIKDLFKKQ